MTYSPTTWVEGGTPCSQGNMNNIEQGIVDYGVPAGVIAMWHGTLANIPTGWHLCDGTSGTPDLLAKFVEGVATDATNPGTTGGSTAKYLAQTGGASTAIGGSAIRSPDAHGGLVDNAGGAGADAHDVTDTISDIRPLFYDLAFIMKL